VIVETPSMFEQSFKFIASVVHQYFTNVPPGAGDRFHLHVEREDEVKELNDALLKKGDRRFGSQTWESRAISFEGGARLIIASSHNASESFLTRLRNHTASQKGPFEGKALLTVHNTSLDSIIKGAQSLNKEGSPLHITAFRLLLKDNLQKLNIHYSEKLALIAKFDSFNTTIHEDQRSILSYYPYMNVIQNGEIKSDDWSTLGLFPDPEIVTITKKQDIEKRIEDNKAMFERVQKSHKYGDPGEDLVKEFIHAGVNELKNASWRKLEYGKVKKWQDDRSIATPPAYQEPRETLFPLDGLTFWERGEGDTTAAKRRRHIIIFNPNFADKVPHTLNFDQVVKQSAISIKGQKNKFVAMREGKNIVVTISECGKQAVIGTVTYNDENASGKYDFNIAVLPFEPDQLNSHKSTYLIKGKRVRFNADDSIIFNDLGANLERCTLAADSEICLTSDTKIVAEITGDLDFDTIKFDLVWAEARVPCELATDTSKPISISGIKIWKAKREEKRPFDYASENKLVFGNVDYFTNRKRTLLFLDIEQQIINDFPNECYWTQHKNGIESKLLNIDQELLNSYKDITRYYNKRGLLPSLTPFTDPELVGLMKAYVECFAGLLGNIKVGQPLSRQDHDLLKVGTVERNVSHQQICFTPLHPLNVAYQLHAQNVLSDEKIPEEILSCLSASDLLPYINGSSGEDDKLCPVLETELPEWTIYRPFSTIHRGWHNEYVHKLIAEKIFEYKSHFPYLFTGSTEAPVKINLINLGNCIDALNGVVRYFLKEIHDAKGDASKIHPLAIQIYDDESGVNKFEEFALYSDPQKITQDFEFSLKTKFLDEYDVLKVIREKLDVYIRPRHEDPQYAHLTFFKFAQDSIQWTYHKIKSVKTGCSLDGLVNAVPSVFSNDEYITGFGSKYTIPGTPNWLLDFATKFNAFARVANTQHPFSPHEATFAALQNDEKKHLEKIYERSNWVTFIDPKVDLNFFKANKNAKELIIIHYSDQYNNTSGYDAITVTKKSKQYRSIIREYLARKGVESEADSELKLINMFNAINGDWLLRLISSKRGHFSREKISILSAVNVMLAVLKHPDIVWVPLSLEEILRVSGGVGLKQKEGLFSVKNLGSYGAHSDDLLMAGVERRGEEVVVHLYPVEVKIGGDQTQKAKVQSLHTANVLKEHLCQGSFRAKFYRNFFAKLIVIAAEKMALYEIFSDNDVAPITNVCRAQLLNDRFSINWDLVPQLGKASVLSFKTANISRKLHLEQDCFLVEMLESDGAACMLKSPDELQKQYNSSVTSVDSNLLLVNSYKQQCDPPIPPKAVTPLYPGPTPLSPGMKILFGHNVNDGMPIIWEPNNTNKVMHTNTGIIGTMGTGKTQFTKSLVTQLIWESKNNVNKTKLGFLIFDYKGDYIKEDFIQATGAKRYDLHRLPFNPLALTVGDTVQPMLPLHTANAIKESISTAFGLGVVQKQKLRDCIMDAYSSFGIDKADKNSWTKAAPTIAQVCEEYLNSGDVKNDSLYAALDNLHQFEIFESDPEQTVSLWSLLDDVVVINLAGYDKDIQNLVVAITLDQFYSQMQKAGHSSIDGDYREISKMVLVDEADNFLSQKFQSIRKILKEGREFGVGTILSTQFLNHFSTGDDEFSNYILTWVVHRVSEISKKDVTTLFGKHSSEMVNQLMTEISGLDKHVSICNVGDGKPLKIRDRAFWQL